MYTRESAGDVAAFVIVRIANKIVSSSDAGVRWISYVLQLFVCPECRLLRCNSHTTEFGDPEPPLVDQFGCLPVSPLATCEHPFRVLACVTLGRSLTLATLNVALRLAPPSVYLQSRINRFALQCQHSKHALMRVTQWFLADESFKSFDTKRELAAGKRALRSNRTRPQPFEVLGKQVLRSVDDAEVLRATTLDRWLCDPSFASAMSPEA
jgi:hypothetical protein